MGEVYRARDTRLKRDVALKVLPASFEPTPDRLARFRREAEVLASAAAPSGRCRPAVALEGRLWLPTSRAAARASRLGAVQPLFTFNAPQMD